MANMVDIEKKSHDELVECSHGPNDKHYPWGTNLRFEDDLVDELGIAALAAGDTVEIRAVAFVESKSEHKSDTTESGEHSEKSISLQLTQVRVSRESADHATQLYGGGDDK